MGISTLRHDFNGVVAPTQSWLTLNNAALGNPVMQFTFQCAGRGSEPVRPGAVQRVPRRKPDGGVDEQGVPTECSAGAITPQEKLLEFSLFDLTSNGGEPTLTPTPTTRDFGSVPVGFSTAGQSFVWKNNSIFAVPVTRVTTTGDFSVTANGCGEVKSGGTCEIDVSFKPMAVGDRVGALTVVSPGKTVRAALTGRGTADFTLAPGTVSFGVGA